MPRCQKWMESSCITTFDEISCRAAIAFCDAELTAPLQLTGKPWRHFARCVLTHDATPSRPESLRHIEGTIVEREFNRAHTRSQPCVGTLCYPESDKITEYLNANSTRNLLGVEISGNFTSCSSDVGRAFALHMDRVAVRTQYYIAGLLDRGIRVLIYAGTYDWRCNWVANYLWTEKLEWAHAAAYKGLKLKDWNVGGNVVGETKSVGGLTFATIRGAGHMVSEKISRCRHDRG